MKKPTLPGEFESRIIEDALKVIGEFDGRPIDNLERIWLRLKANLDNPSIAKYVFEKIQKALKEEQAWYLEAVSDLLAYKEYWGPKFDLQRRLKEPLSRQYPDPADIMITSPTDFKFLGPVTADEAKKWKLFQDGREAFFLVAHEIMDKAGDVTTVDEAKAHWDKLRRKYYRMTRHLPVAFKKKHPATFPAFDPDFTMPEEDAKDEAC
ncbi:MAG: hypothetical protein ABJ242_01845 [Marinomonas sp.]